MLSLLGLAPFSLTKSHCIRGKEFRHTWKRLMYTAMMIFVISAFLILSKPWRDNDLTTWSLPNKFLICFRYAEAILALIFSVIFISPKLNIIFSKVENIDAVLFQNLSVLYKKTFIFLSVEIIIILIIGLSSTLFYQQLNLQNLADIFDQLLFTQMQLQRYAMNMQFINLVFLIQHRLKVLNMNIEKLATYGTNNEIKNKKCWTRQEFSTEQRYDCVVQDLRILQKTYDDIFITSSILNSTFGFLILENMTANMFRITASLYYTTATSNIVSSKGK